MRRNGLGGDGMTEILALSFFAMCAQDILAVSMVQAEARNKKALAGGLDVLAWLAAFLTLHNAQNAMNGHDLGLKVWIIVVVSAANFVGSYTGTLLGEKYIKPAPDPLAAALVAKGLISQAEIDSAKTTMSHRRRPRRGLMRVVPGHRYQVKQ